MIKKENYPKAYKEVYIILSNMDKKDVELIPKEFMDIIKENMNKEYDFKLDNNKILVCATEMNTQEEIDNYIKSVS